MFNEQEANNIKREIAKIEETLGNEDVDVDVLQMSYNIVSSAVQEKIFLSLQRTNDLLSQILNSLQPIEKSQ